jgi:hypothetical protein
LKILTETRDRQYQKTKRLDCGKKVGCKSWFPIVA